MRDVRGSKRYGKKRRMIRWIDVEKRRKFNHAKKINSTDLVMNVVIITIILAKTHRQRHTHKEITSDDDDCTRDDDNDIRCSLWT